MTSIEYADFAKLEIRIGKVVEATVPEWSEKLLQLTVDFGADVGTRTIFSGIKAWYSPEELSGKQFAFVVNLAEKKMGPAVSQGMMLMADTAEKPQLLPVSQEVPVGTLVR